MVMADGEQTPAEAFAQGKMLQDQARERGQRNYEALEKEIRENGEKWLKEEQMHEEKAKEEGMKAMKSGFTGWFGGGHRRSSDCKCNEAVNPTYSRASPIISSISAAYLVGRPR